MYNNFSFSIIDTIYVETYLRTNDRFTNRLLSIGLLRIANEEQNIAS